MESIEPAAEQALVDRLRLCPACYLVAWEDERGVQIRQGVPVTNVSN
jgi:hypothetical protein